MAVEPFTELAPVVLKVTVPPAVVLVKPVTTSFCETSVEPPAGMVKLCEMKVKLPEVLVVILVSLFLNMEVFRLPIASEMAVNAPEEATEQVNVVKLLLSIFKEEVAVPVVVSTTMPCKVAEAPCVRAMVLSVMVLARVPVGALENEGT